jgi:HD-GYP domain-containing protein (c-di-GMP phosphodiesterase class II)
MEESREAPGWAKLLRLKAIFAASRKSEGVADESAMDALNVIHSPDFPIAKFRDALERDSIASRVLTDPAELSSSQSGLTVVLLDPTLARNGHDHPDIGPRVTVLGLGLRGAPSWISDDKIFLHLAADPAPEVLMSAVRRAFQFLYQKMRADQLERQLEDRRRELRQINEIGIALSTVRDHSVLLTMILSKARELSRADAGSLYLLEHQQEGGRVLRFKLAQNDSVDVDFQETVLEITKKSLAGFVALTGETLVIDDAYNLPADVEYSINASFDEKNAYLTKSLLVFPMTNHVGDIIGVLQLINRRRSGAPARLRAEDVPANVIPFDQATIDIMRSLAGQAAVAVENNLLYEAIQRLFEGFVTAAVTAIEQRDPTTSGHSARVADLTVEMATTIDRLDSGEYRTIRFSLDQIREIRYASLLHDFGKVGVREQVLVKEKKLYPLQLDTIRTRFEFMMKALEQQYTKQKLDYLLQHGREGFEQFSRTIDERMAGELAQLQKDFQFVAQSNEPSVLPEGEFQYLQDLARREYEDMRGTRSLLLHPDEARILSIRKGNLDASERGEIESHVTHTFNFLSKIPWTRDLMDVPNIAYAHHEKLNGRGYPRKLAAPEIPLQSRIMTVSDIYDALTASDRPYKRAISTDRAIDILQMEVKDGLLDGSLVNIFIETKVYEKAGVLRM